MQELNTSESTEYFLSGAVVFQVESTASDAIKNIKTAAEDGQIHGTARIWGILHLVGKRIGLESVFRRFFGYSFVIIQPNIKNI